MTLLAPWALWFSAIGAAVVALYFLKIKRRRQTVPALEFWRELIGQTQVRSLFQRLKRWLSLLLWLLIVTCLVLAVGNPIFSIGRIKPRSIVLILDNSASMQTIEGEDETASRLQLAQAALRDILGRRPVSDEWMLIEAGKAPRVLASWTRDREAIRRAAEEVAPHLGAADLRGAVKLATQLLAGKERPCAVILSDGAAGQVAELIENNELILQQPVGNTNDNLGITRLRLRPHRPQAAHHAYVRVANASDEQIETQIVFQLDGVTWAVEPVTVEPGGAWETTVIFNAPEGAVLRASLERPDALAVDNEVFSILEPMKLAAIWLVTPPEEAYFFEQALLAMQSLVDPEASRTMTIDDYEELSNNQAAPDLMVFNNCAPSRLPKTGRFLFVNDWPDDFPAKKIGILANPMLLVARRDHPLMRHLVLDAAALARALRVDLSDRAVVLAKTADDWPLVFHWQEPDREALCLTFDVLESDLPFRNAFPMLLRNAVTFFVTEPRKWVHPEYQVGDVIEPIRQLPDDIAEVTVARLGGQKIGEEKVAVESGSFALRETDNPGPLRITIADEPVYTVINLTDERESRIGPVAPAASLETQLALTRRVFGVLPWLALSMLATALIGIEWLTYHFRWTE